MPELWCPFSVVFKVFLSSGAHFLCSRIQNCGMSQLWCPFELMFDGLQIELRLKTDQISIKKSIQRRSKTRCNLGSILNGFWIDFWPHLPRRCRAGSSKTEMCLLESQMIGTSVPSHNRKHSNFTHQGWERSLTASNIVMQDGSGCKSRVITWLVFGHPPPPIDS